MAVVLVEEDGTGEDPTANSYVTLAEAQAYWDNLRFDWTVYAPNAVLESALIKATNWIELKYRNNFIGYRLLYNEQPLSWPRGCAYLYSAPIEGVPVQVKNATFEYAKLELTQVGGLNPVPTGFDATGQLLQESMVKVGPIEKMVKYETGSATVLRSYPTIDGMLSELLMWSGGVIRN
jgi:hypothetical protein